MWIGLGQAVTIIGALFGVRVLTGILTPEAYGELALGMTVATLVNQVAFGPLNSGAARLYAPACEANALPDYFAAARSLARWAAVLMVLLIGVLCLGLLCLGQSQWIGLTLAAVFFALCSGYNSIFNGMQNAARQRVIVALHQGLASWGRFLLAALLTAWLGATSTVTMFAYALAMIIVLASQRRFLGRVVTSRVYTNRRPPTVLQEDWQRRLVAYAWPFACWGGITWAQMVSDRWSLQLSATANAVGLYAVLYQVGYYPISILTDLITQLLSPVLFQRAGDAKSSNRMQTVYAINRQLTHVALALTAIAFLLTLLLRNAIFHTFVASDYSSVAWLIPWMVLAGGLFASGQVAVLGLLSSTQSKLLLLPKVCTALLGIVLNYLGATLYGVPGVVGASIVFGATYLAWVLRLSTIHSKSFDSVLPVPRL